MSTEFETKLDLIKKLLDHHRVDAILLRRVSSFAWATCGASSYINTAVTEGAATLLITAHHHYLLTNNIEAPRLQNEAELTDQGWEWLVSPWTDPQKELYRVVTGKRLAADVAFPEALNIGDEISRIRAILTPVEQDRFRNLGQICATALETTLPQLGPGMTEFEIAALLGCETQKLGAQPIVNLIATDERVFNYRHPLPTDKKLDNYGMLVLCGRKWGLVCSITRLIHFGAIPTALNEKILATAAVNAALINATRPAATLGDVFKHGQQVYAAQGYPDEWQQHHQGGATGYEPREFLGLPKSTDLVVAGQAYAWNPSIRGAKVEDTILVGEFHNEVVTQTPSLPTELIDGIPCSVALEIN